MTPAPSSAATLLASELGLIQPGDRATFLVDLLQHTAAALVVVQGRSEAAETAYRAADRIVARGAL